jgi:hypothetical protein
VVLVGRAVEYRGLPRGDAMKIICRFALAAVAAAGLVFATSAPAEAVDPHKHIWVDWAKADCVDKYAPL